MKAATAIVLLCCTWMFFGCTSCSGNSDGDTGTGETDSDSDSDTDSDSDSDTDMDTDSDTETETATTEISDAGPWDWEDLPEGEDCGEGCEQLTFSEEVRMKEWDVWNSLLVYTDETLAVNLIDVINRRHLLIPNSRPEYPIGSMGSSVTMYPVVYENVVVYSQYFDASPDFAEIIRADFNQEVQEILYHTEEDSDGDLEPGRYLDIYENRIVGAGGCGNFNYHELCFFPMPALTQPTVLLSDNYGGFNSIWTDTLVFQDIRDYPYDIMGYDFAKKEFFDIAVDDETQLNPRIQETRIVYQDLRLGTDDGMGNWNHSAVFMHDLTTGKKTQVTSGKWIAAYPDIWENIIVWADYRDSANPNDKNSLSGVQIWGYSLETKQEFKITNVLNRSKTTPRIWGDKVFVHMYKEDSSENAIYMFDLPAKAFK